MNSPEKITVLYIDDEMNNLNSFKAAFRMDYTVLTANSATEAAEILNRRYDIRIVLSDQRMPEKTGIEFFEEIYHTNPLPVRMLITGYTDIGSVISAINKGHVFRYIPKPWKEDEVRAALQEGYAYWKATSQLALRNDELRAANKELDNLDNSINNDVREQLNDVGNALALLSNRQQTDELKNAVDAIARKLGNLDESLKRLHEEYESQRA